MHVDTELSRSFVENGWLVLDLGESATGIVHQARRDLLERLREKWIPNLESLESYHLYVDDDHRHTDIQADLTKLYQERGFGPAIVRESVTFFRDFIGPDIHVQKYPYMRIARPGKSQDNIGIHRDTHYGCSPYELSVSIPFTTTGTPGSLGVVPGSHVLPESAFPVTQTKSKDVEKGSVKHQLGFLYAPKQMSDDVRRSVIPIDINVGQALVFSLSLIHGQEINRSQVSRFQSDIRVVNSLAPIQWERNVHTDYYETLAVSPVTKQAKIYLTANAACGSQGSS